MKIFSQSECYRTDLHSPNLENNTKASINGQYLVDYEKKRAVFFRIEQSGINNNVTTLHENVKVHCYYYGLTQDDETQMPRDEYCSTNLVLKILNVQQKKKGKLTKNY